MNDFIASHRVSFYQKCRVGRRTRGWLSFTQPTIASLPLSNTLCEIIGPILLNYSAKFILNRTRIKRINTVTLSYILSRNLPVSSFQGPFRHHKAWKCGNVLLCSLLACHLIFRYDVLHSFNVAIGQCWSYLSNDILAVVKCNPIWKVEGQRWVWATSNTVSITLASPAVQASPLELRCQMNE